jgi:hypothetical protein
VRTRTGTGTEIGASRLRDLWSAAFRLEALRNMCIGGLATCRFAGVDWWLKIKKKARRLDDRLWWI